MYLLIALDEQRRIIGYLDDLQERSTGWVVSDAHRPALPIAWREWRLH